MTIYKRMASAVTGTASTSADPQVLSTSKNNDSGVVAQGLRQQIYRELHDGLGLELTVLSILATQLNDEAKTLTGQKSEGTQALVRDVLGQVSRTVLVFRESLSLLTDTAANDSAPSEGNLPELLQALVQAVSQSQNMQGSFIAHTWTGVAPPEKCEALRMCARELLNNMAKHAKASAFHLELSRNGNQLSLRLTDDGVGFPQELDERQPKAPLSSLIERLALHQGTITVEAGAHQVGSRITVSLPCV